MYAVAFDLNQEALKAAYPSENSNYAYALIGKVLNKHGFVWQQGSVYFGNATVNPVTTVLAIQEIAQQFSWFAPAVSDIRMLRIEENNDLRPAIDAAIGIGRQGDLGL